MHCARAGTRFVPKAEERLLAVVHALLHRCYKMPFSNNAEVPASLKKELSGARPACARPVSGRSKAPAELTCYNCQARLIPPGLQRPPRALWDDSQPQCSRSVATCSQWVRCRAHRARTCSARSLCAIISPACMACRRVQGMLQRGAHGAARPADGRVPRRLRGRPRPRLARYASA